MGRGPDHPPNSATRLLAVTPAEDVPLQIEAATNHPLKSVAWFTAVNGGEETTHALPTPEEPLFAAYQPVLQPKQT